VADNERAFRVRLFGALEVESGQRVFGPRDFEGIKPKQMFELLVLARGGLVSKERFAELLWSRNPPRNVAATLETYISVLRKALVQERPDAGLRPIVTERGAYRLEWTHFDLDLDQFDELVMSRPGVSPRGRRASLERAIALVKGDVLEDEPYSIWTGEVRERYRQRVSLACIEAAELAIGDEDHPAVVRNAERAAELDPLSERACRALMIGHYALGRREEALRVYQRCASALAQELDSDPDLSTMRLHGAIQRREDWRSAAYRVLDGFEPATLSAQAHPTIPLVGRAAVVTTLTQLIGNATASTFSLICVSGEPGSGRTRLLDAVTPSVPATLVARVAGNPMFRDMPFVCLASLLRQLLDAGQIDSKQRAPFAALLPELRRLAGNSVSEIESFEALVSFAHAHAPIAIIVDDAELADPGTLRALVYLRDRCAEIPGLVILAIDRTLDARADGLVQLRPDHVVTLDRLDPDDLSDLGGNPAHLRTGGLPQLLAGIQHGDGSWTNDVARWVTNRSRRAGARAQRLLTIAACLDQPFDAETLATISRDDLMIVIEELECLQAHGLIDTAGIGYLVRDVLVREILAASVSPGRRHHVRRLASELPLDPNAARSGVPARAGVTAFDREPRNPVGLRALKER
jgi:DNA-binding SARP family transcriptional activator